MAEIQWRKAPPAPEPLGPPKPTSPPKKSPIPADKPSIPLGSGKASYSKDGKSYDKDGWPVKNKPAPVGGISGSNDDLNKYVKDKENAPAPGGIKTDDVGDKKKIEQRNELVRSLVGTNVSVISDGQKIDGSTLKKKSPGSYGVRDEDGNKGNPFGGSGISAPEEGSPKGINFNGTNIPVNGQKPPSSIKLDGQEVKTPPRPPPGSIIDDKGNIIPPSGASRPENVGGEKADPNDAKAAKELDQVNDRLRSLAEKDQQNARRVDEAKNNHEITREAEQNSDRDVKAITAALESLEKTRTANETDFNNNREASAKSIQERIDGRNEKIAELNSYENKLNQERSELQKKQSNTKDPEKKQAYEDKIKSINDEIRNEVGPDKNKLLEEKSRLEQVQSDIRSTKFKDGDQIKATELADQKKQLEDIKKRAEKDLENKKNDLNKTTEELNEAKKKLEEDGKKTKEERSELEKKKATLEKDLKNGDNSDGKNISKMAELLNNCSTIMEKLKTLSTRVSTTSCIPCKSFEKSLKEISLVALAKFNENSANYNGFSAAVEAFPKSSADIRLDIERMDRVISQLEKALKVAGGLLKENKLPGASSGALSNSILKTREQLEEYYKGRNELFSQLEAMSERIITFGEELLKNLSFIRVESYENNFDNIEKQMKECESKECGFTPGSGGSSGSDSSVSGIAKGTLTITLYDFDTEGTFQLAQIPVNDKDEISYTVPSDLSRFQKPNSRLLEKEPARTTNCTAERRSLLSTTYDIKISFSTSKSAEVVIFYGEVTRPVNPGVNLG